MNNTAFQRNLKHFMVEKDCTQEDVAKGCDVSPAAVSHWYTGRSRPKGMTLVRLAHYFDTTPSTLMGDMQSFFLVDEERLIRDFRMLSPKGKELAIARMEELKQLYWYDKERDCKSM